MPRVLAASKIPGASALFPSLGRTGQYAWDHYIPVSGNESYEPRGVCEQGYWDFNSELQSSAKKATLLSFFDCRWHDIHDAGQRRLFRYPDADLSDTERTKAWADRHHNEPVGVVSESVYYDSQPWVGLLRGIRNGGIGYGLCLASSPGVEQYCDWAAIIHVCMLPRNFRVWRWEE